MENSKAAARAQRKRRIRRKVHGTASQPRMTIFKSNKHVYIQVIDDDAGRTLASVSSLSPAVREQLGEKSKVDVAKTVGTEAAKACLAAGITKVVYDRNGYPYHKSGRVGVLADAAREAGLKL